MGYTDLLDYVKRSQESSVKTGDNMRFQLTTLKDNGVVLLRHKMSEISDVGTISASRVFTKHGGNMHFQGMPTGVVKMDDIAFLLKDSKVRLADTLDIDVYNSKKNVGNLDLGEALIDYTDDHDEDLGYADPGSIFIPLLRTDKSVRRKGMAAKLVSDVSKFAAMHGYEIVYGVGSPLEDDFKFSGKTMLDRSYTRRYIDEAIKTYGDDFSYEAAAELALFYRKLGFNIMPLGRQFMFRKVTKQKSYNELDRTFLFNDTTLLDTDEMVLNK